MSRLSDRSLRTFAFAWVVSAALSVQTSFAADGPVVEPAVTAAKQALIGAPAIVPATPIVTPAEAPLGVTPGPATMAAPAPAAAAGAPASALPPASAPAGASPTNASAPLAEVVGVRHAVKAATGRIVSYEIFKGQANQPVYVTLNGLIFKYNNWNKMTQRLAQSGATVIRMDFSTDPDSLIAAKNERVVSVQPFRIEDLPAEIDAVLAHAGIQTKFTLLTLSYGSVGIEYAAQAPDKLDRLILMSPMILPSDHYHAYGTFTREWGELAGLQPGTIAYESYWATFMEPFVRLGVYSHIVGMGDYIPKQLTATEVTDGIILKIKATRMFDLRNYVTKALPRIDLLVAAGEAEGEANNQFDFWKQLPESTKGSLVLMRKTFHGLPAEAPERTADVVKLVRAKDGSEVQPFVMAISNEDGSFEVKGQRIQ